MPEERSLAALLRAVRDGWRLLVLAVVMCALLGLLATALQPERYRATGSVVVSPATFLDPNGTDALPALTDTIVELSSSQAVLGPAASSYIAMAPDGPTRLSRSHTATLDWLRRNARARRVSTSSVIELSATGTRERDAVDLARAFVSALSTFVRDTRADSAPLDAQNPGARLVVLSAGRPDGQISPTLPRNLLIGLNAGLILGVVLALAYGVRRRGRDPARAAAELGVPWLGLIQPGLEDRDAGLFATHYVLEAVSASRGTLVVALTGTVDSERIAEVAETLVRSLGRSGNRALVIDGDRQRRAISRRLGADQCPGLSAVLDGVVEVTEATVLVVEVDPAGETGEVPVNLLAMGPVSPSSGAGPDPTTLRRALEGLRLHFDVIVVSGPTLGRSPDLAVLTSVADCWLLVTDGDVTARRLDDARAFMDQTATPVMGMLGVDGGHRRPREPAAA